MTWGGKCPAVALGSDHSYHPASPNAPTQVVPLKSDPRTSASATHQDSPELAPLRWYRLNPAPRPTRAICPALTPAPKWFHLPATKRPKASLDPHQIPASEDSWATAAATCFESFWHLLYYYACVTSLLLLCPTRAGATATPLGRKRRMRPPSPTPPGRLIGPPAQASLFARAALAQRQRCAASGTRSFRCVSLGSHDVTCWNYPIDCIPLPITT